MTSEVLIFNKRGVIVAADSAVTSSASGQVNRPRYAKTANKIFELADSGSVAVAIFGSASVDAVPWELVIKLFRKTLGSARLQTVSEYGDALVRFLAGNSTLFPQAALDRFESDQFEAAVVAVLRLVNENDASLLNENASAADRTTAWQTGAPIVEAQILSDGLAAPLSEAGLQKARDAVPSKWTALLETSFESAPGILAAVVPQKLAEMAHRFRYTYPEKLLGYTGVVVVGYGEGEIFPGYRHQNVFGHVGHELYAKDQKSGQIQHHDCSSMIVPLAQKSMIDQFTDGFSFPLWSIINTCSRKALDQLVTQLNTQGVGTGGVNTDAIVADVHTDFMKDWARQNWDENYHPLMGVLTTLSIEEMAHLAETLLILQSLKERVTSASEEVGGPIDVAAITKSEGLVWIKRKHYFGPELNQRYLARLARDIHP